MRVGVGVIVCVGVGVGVWVSVGGCGCVWVGGLLGVCHKLFDSLLNMFFENPF